ncbi:MAG: aminodeoxychorismate/anthranilate synthase component II [Prevotellaceae bacterium]|jgi:anthranilate synthase component 2|nr:aminodeoxychorismate/anthranilate synthase component II [Prevotellaceae bacterium]
MKLVLIDNYDSFTYNLAHALKALGAEVDVVRNDQFAPADLAGYDRIVLSPGPGIPREAGLLLEVIRTYAGVKPILGICLGHQAIGEVFGAKLKNLTHVYHGVQTEIRGTLENASPLLVGRYHSWVVDADDFPDCLEITAVDAQGNIMALRHRRHDIYGVQFHPESVLTPQGTRMLGQWLSSSASLHSFINKTHPSL